MTSNIKALALYHHWVYPWIRESGSKMIFLMQLCNKGAIGGFGSGPWLKNSKHQNKSDLAWATKTLATVLMDVIYEHAPKKNDKRRQKIFKNLIKNMWITIEKSAWLYIFQCDQKAFKISSFILSFFFLFLPCNFVFAISYCVSC